MSVRESRLFDALAEAVRRGDIFSRDISLPTESRSVPGERLSEFIWDLSPKEQARGLRLQGIVIDGNLDLDHLDWRGRLSLTNCVVRGDVSLAYARIEGPLALGKTELGMLALNSAVIDGGALCADLVAHRGLFALGSRITGALALQRAFLQAPEEDERKNRAALDLYRAEIGDLYANRALLRGGFYGIGVTVTRNVRLAGAQVWPRAALGLVQGPDAGDGIDLAGANVRSTIYLWTSASGPLEMHAGSIRLENATCRNLRVTASQLRPNANIEGLTYTNVGPISGQEILSVLDNQVPCPRKAYTQLAAFAEATAAVDLKRATMLHQQRRLTSGRHWWTPSRLRHTLYGWLKGYGYAPGRATAWLLGCLALSSALIRWQGGSVHAKSGAASITTWPQAIAFTMDKVVPFSSSGYADQWFFSPHGSAEWACFYAFMTLKFAAWALGVLALAAVSGIVRTR